MKAPKSGASMRRRKCWRAIDRRRLLNSSGLPEVPPRPIGKYDRPRKPSQAEESTEKTAQCPSSFASADEPGGDNDPNHAHDQHHDGKRCDVAFEAGFHRRKNVDRKGRYTGALHEERDDHVVE